MHNAFAHAIAKATIVRYYDIMLQYFVGVASEFKQIRWLSAKRAFILTIITLVATFIFGFALGATDSLFATILRNIVIDTPKETVIPDDISTPDDAAASDNDSASGNTDIPDDVGVPNGI